MSDRDTERLRNRDSDDTQETKDVPSLAAFVGTLQEAVQLSVKAGLGKDCLFTFARALKAFEITHRRRLTLADLRAAFALWWSAAKPLLPPEDDFDEWRFDFENTFAKTHAPRGANSLQEAIRRADAGPMPPQAARYTSPRLQRLVAVCYHLQLLQGDSAFFLGVRDAAKITGAKGLTQASAWLAGLLRDGVLTEVEKGTRKRATRFRFNLPQPAPAGHITAPASVEAAPVTSSKSKAAKPSQPRRPSTYDLVERKKALQDLIKAMPHRDYWKADDRKRYKQLQAELANVTIRLAGIAE